MKNVPLSSSRTTASTCAGFVRASGPRMTTCCSANIGWRTAQSVPAQDEHRQRRDRDRDGNRIQLARVIPHARLAGCRRKARRTYRPACLAAIGTRLWPVMPGDVLTSRNVHRPSGLRIRSSRPQPEQPMMRNAVERLRLDRSFDRGIDSRRAEVLGVVRKILVVIVVVAVRRFDADQRQRDVRRGSMPSVRCRRRIPRR